MGFLALLGSIIPAILGIVNKSTLDKTKVIELETALKSGALNIILKQLEGEYLTMQKQLDINKEEAASTSVFVSGWRPFLGWACGIAFVTVTALFPILAAFLGLFGITLTIPHLDITAMVSLLTGMLGLGGLRSYDKKQVLNNKQIYDNIRLKFGGHLTQEQVNLINQTIEEVK